MKHNATQNIRASTPGKIVLFGEHFVVYDKPAILASISRYINVTASLNDTGKILIKSIGGRPARYPQTKIGTGSRRTSQLEEYPNEFLDPLYKIVRRTLSERGISNIGMELEFTSNFPYGIGLGSSAACCVSITAVMDFIFDGKKIDRLDVCRKAAEAETIIHKNSSGADCYVCTLGGLIYYSRNEGFSRIETRDRLSFIIANTGIKHSTADLIMNVKKFKEENLSVFQDLATQARKICGRALTAIRVGDRIALGKLMNENHSILQKIGVSHEKTDDIIKICRRSGAAGAKITGAGGGGAVIALTENVESERRIISQIKKNGYNCFVANIDFHGVKVW